MDNFGNEMYSEEFHRLDGSMGLQLFKVMYFYGLIDPLLSSNPFDSTPVFVEVNPI
jgi:hypothetical protein